MSMLTTPLQLTLEEGASLFYIRAGAGIPVVLLHGHALDHRMWGPQINALAIQGYQVVAYDQRGHGRSSNPSGPYSHVRDLATLLDAQPEQPERVHLMAFSAGTLHALEFVLTHPERVRSLVLMSPSGFTGVPFQESIRASFRALRKAARQGGLEAALPVWKRFEWLEHAMQHADAQPLLEAICADYSGYHWLERDSARYLEPPAITRLEEVRCPTLVLCGALDTAYNRGLAERLVREVGGARSVECAGVGHFPNLEAASVVNQALLAFLETA